MGPAIEIVGKESCQSAAEEKRKLVIEKIDEICNKLPREIVEKIYPFHCNLRASIDSTAKSGANEVDSPVDNISKFNQNLSEIITIIVSYDMGWSKRGNERSYDNFNGYDCIIGFLSGKVLDHKTCNRKCLLSDLGHTKDNHDCRLNFQGGSKAMEPNVEASLANNNKILDKSDLEVRVQSDKNHVQKSFTSEPNVEASLANNSKVLDKSGLEVRVLSDKNHVQKSFTSEPNVEASLANNSKILDKSGLEVRVLSDKNHLQKSFTSEPNVEASLANNSKVLDKSGLEVRVQSDKNHLQKSFTSEPNIEASLANNSKVLDKSGLEVRVQSDKNHLQKSFTSEPNVEASLANNSKILDKSGLEVRVLSDKNHVQKSFTSEPNVEASLANNSKILDKSGLQVRVQSDKTHLQKSFTSEPNVEASLANNSKILDKSGLEVRVLSDKNHVQKSFTSEPNVEASLANNSKILDKSGLQVRVQSDKTHLQKSFTSESNVEASLANNNKILDKSGLQVRVLSDKNHVQKSFTREPNVEASLANNSKILDKSGLQVRVLSDKNHVQKSFTSEPNVAASLVNNSKVLDKSGLEARVLSDKNHLQKSFTGELYGLCTTFNEMKKEGVVTHINECLSNAIAQNKGKSAQLAAAILSIPGHLFNEHGNCGSWCHRGQIDSGKQTILLKNRDLYKALNDIFTKYAKNSQEFCVAASSQANESIDNIMAHKAPKNCYSRSESDGYRYSSAICTKNKGDSHIMSVNEKLSPGKHTTLLTSVIDETWKKSAMTSNLPSTKRRRIILNQRRDDLTQMNEKTEGVQYQSNCGFSDQIIGSNEDHGLQAWHADSPNTTISSKTSNIVYFDLETSGFRTNDEILQIAAQYENHKFSVYVTPTKEINPEASKHTGLKNINGQLYFYDDRVITISLEDALHAFQQFLSFAKKSSLLVAHNASFDISHLIRAILKCNMDSDFNEVIAGFSDSLPLFKKRFNDRTGEGAFKLQNLAKDFLTQESDGTFHEASYDVNVLKLLASVYLRSEDIFSAAKSFDECINHVIDLQKIATVLPSLGPLKSILKCGILRKMAKEELTHAKLKKIYDEEGEEGLVSILTLLKNGKPQVTKNKRIIAQIVTFYKTKNM